MSTYQLLVHQQDIGFLLEAIDLRARFLKDMIQQDVRATDEERARQRDAEQRRKEDEARRAAMPDPFETQIIVKPDPAPAKVPTRKQKRVAMIKLIKSSAAEDLTTAEIARRAGVSYATAHKARKAFAPKKGRK